MHKRRLGSGRGRFADSALGEAGPCGAPPSGARSSPLRVCLRGGQKQQCCCREMEFFRANMRKAARNTRCIGRSDCKAWRECAKAMRNAVLAARPQTLPGSQRLWICQRPTQVGQLAVTGTGAAGTATAGPAGTAGPHGQAGPYAARLPPQHLQPAHVRTTPTSAAIINCRMSMISFLQRNSAAAGAFHQRQERTAHRRSLTRRLGFPRVASSVAHSERPCFSYTVGQRPTAINGC